MRIARLLCCAAVLAAASAHASEATPGSHAEAAGAEAKRLPAAQRLERRFLQITAANLSFQAEASRLALTRSGNPAVKDLANTLMARQQKSHPELLRLLDARGMALPIPTHGHGKVLKKLAKLSGEKFDRFYVDEVVTTSSKEDIANCEKMATQAEDPVLRAWVERQLPVLRFQVAKAGRALPGDSLRGHPAPADAQRAW
jgi:putative membrane protein